MRLSPSLSAPPPYVPSSLCLRTPLTTAFLLHTTPYNLQTRQPVSPRSLTASANESIGPQQGCRGDGEPQGFCSFQIDDQLNLMIRLHRNPPWFLPLEHLVYQ